MLIAEAAGRALADLGVRDAFGLIGSGNFVVTQAMVERGVRFVSARHENAAVSMADGYARVSGRPGVVTVHQGPGLTNAMTALTEAAKARTSLLVIAADTSAVAVRSNFRVDQAALAEAVGAVAERARSPVSAADDLARAWARAVIERRTVLFSFPLDVQAADAPAAFAVSSPSTPEPAAPSTDDVSRAADVLASARAPVVVGGRGAVLANAGPAIERLAERVGALLATSANGHGLLSGSPWSLGISGGFASPAAAGFLREADVVLAVGASLNMWTTRHGQLFPNARVVQIDDDPDSIGAHRAVDIGVVGDARLTVDAITAELEERARSSQTYRRDEVARVLARRPRVPFDDASDGERIDPPSVRMALDAIRAKLEAEGYSSPGWRRDDVARAIAGGRWDRVAYDDASDGERIDPRTLSIALDELLPRERTVAVDSGHFMGWPPMFLRVPDAAGFVFTQSFQSIGLGLSSAIGAAVARPDRLTVACLGDGGALMAAGEFETLVRLALPVLVVVYDDAAYGAEVHHFGPQGRPTDLVRFPDPDIAGMARGLGAQAQVVKRVDDLQELRRWLERRDGPMVVDAKVQPAVVAEWLEEAFRAH